MSLERLSVLANVSLTKTKEAVARLVELGVIAKQRTHQWIDGLRRQGRNVYRFLAPRPEVAARLTDPGQDGKRRNESRTARGLRRALTALHRKLTGERRHEPSTEQQDAAARANAQRQLAALL